MNKLRLFTENFLVYGLGGIISKIIPFIMLPIVTRLMPNSAYFGISDLSNTIVSFASALAVMGMYDAMYRMFFENDENEYKKNVCSTALSFTITTSIAVFIIMLICKDFISKVFFGDTQYAYLVYITAAAALVEATNSIVAAPTRMQNKKMVFLITNTVSPILSYSISIPLLLKGHYVIALPLAAAISGITMEITFVLLNHQWFRFKRFDNKLLRQMLVIAVPLLPNFLVYWIFNSSDKLMIANIIDVAASGIYSVGAKLGNASQLIYTAFAGGWQYFAFSTMREENQVKTNSLIFEYLGIISFVATAFICAWSFVIYSFLFTGDYIKGYIIAPYLFLAPLLQMLFQVACNQFLVIKKTWPNMVILSIGAVINIIINLILIPKIGIEGAAVATLAGYLLSDIICVFVLVKMNLMIVSIRFIGACLIMFAYMFIWRMLLSNKPMICTGLALLTSISFILLYKKEVLTLLRNIKEKR